MGPGAYGLYGGGYGLGRFIPLFGLGVLAVGALTLFQRLKWRTMFGFGAPTLPSTSFASTGLSSGFTSGTISTSSITSAPAPIMNERGRLIAKQRVPGERIKEVDMITRKRVPYHEEVEVFEGPASFETYQGGEREYMDANIGYQQQQQQQMAVGPTGLEGGETITAPARSRGGPMVSNRRVPMRDRLKSKVLRRPVVTNYY